MGERNLEWEIEANTFGFKIDYSKEEHYKSVSLKKKKVRNLETELSQNLHKVLNPRGSNVDLNVGYDVWSYRLMETRDINHLLIVVILKLLTMMNGKKEKEIL